MADDEDLGSFFAEINQIPIQEDELNKQISPPSNEIGPVDRKRKFEQDEPVQVTQVVAAAAPQLNKSNSYGHVVYTYDMPYGIDTSAQLPPSQVGSSNNVYGYGEKSQPPPPPMPAPSLSSYAQMNQSSLSSSGPKQPKTFVRTGGGDTWLDETLAEWPDNDFRIFVGDLGKEVNTEMLAKAFQHYKSFAKAKVVKSKVENKGRGYGFVSFLDPMDCAKAIREMNDKYLGTRPMKIRKSTWKDRDIEKVKEKEHKRRKLQESLGLA